MNLPLKKPVFAIDANAAAAVDQVAAYIAGSNRALAEVPAAARTGSMCADAAEALAVNEACYRIAQLTWSIMGTARADADQPVIIKRATRNADGSVCVGATIGAVAVGPDGTWEFMQSGLEQMPDGATYVHVTTSRGAGRTAPLSIVV